MFDRSRPSRRGSMQAGLRRKYFQSHFRGFIALQMRGSAAANRGTSARRTRCLTEGICVQVHRETE